MNELDEDIAGVYRATNNEILNLLRESQKSLYKCNVILSLICVVLSVSVIVISYIGCLNNQKWLEVFNSYEYETQVIECQQAGKGQNNINTGIMGDIMDGAKTNDCTKNQEEESNTKETESN